MIYEINITPEWGLIYEVYTKTAHYMGPPATYLHHMKCYDSKPIPWLQKVHPPYRYACLRCLESLTKEESKQMEDFVLSCDLAEIL